MAFVFQSKKVTTTNDPFSTLFETDDPRTPWSGVFRPWDPIKVDVGHSLVTQDPLISSDKPRSLSIETNQRQHTTQAVIKSQLTF